LKMAEMLAGHTLMAGSDEEANEKEQQGVHQLRRIFDAGAQISGDSKDMEAREMGPSLQANAMAATTKPEAKTLLVASSEEEWAGIRRAIEEVQATSLKMGKEGLSQIAFFIGVVNIAVTGFVIGRFPEYLWVLYLVKVFTYIPAWFVEVTRRYNGSLWVLDFCWVSNISLGSYMLLNLIYADRIPAEVQRWAWLWFYSTALGPLSWAALALQNGLIFHSIERTASLFIHFTPSVVAWTLRWSPELMSKAWPGHFTEETLAQASVKDIYVAGVTMYFVWLVLHGAWLLTVGVDAPKKGYSTIFEGLYEKNKLGEKFSKTFGVKSLRGHAAIYLAMHAFCCSLTFTWAMLCYRFWMVHTAWCVLLFISTVWMGAGYYMYIFTNVYTKALKKLIPAQEDPAHV